MKKEVREISPEVITILQDYDFRNVRELENIIERGVALANGVFLKLPIFLKT